MFGRKKNPDPKTGVDYEKLGRAMESVLVRDYIDLLGSTRRQIMSAFTRGIFMGLGTVIGATLVLSVLLWLLHLLGGLPIIGEYLQGAGQSLRTK